MGLLRADLQRACACAVAKALRVSVWRELWLVVSDVVMLILKVVAALCWCVGCQVLKNLCVIVEEVVVNAVEAFGRHGDELTFNEVTFSPKIAWLGGQVIVTVLKPTTIHLIVPQTELYGGDLENSRGRIMAHEDRNAIFLENFDVF